jgi:ubiquinone/menaquinone biosynthesis C-methylase UbiE
VASAVGIEFSTAMLKAAQRRFASALARDELRLESGSLTALPLPDGSLDGAMASIADAGLDLIDHRRVGEGRVPSHLLVTAA